jgi:hypothetical protein
VRGLKKLLLSILLIITLVAGMSNAQADKVNICTYFESYLVLDARVRAQGPLQGDGVRNYSLIYEEYNLGLDGEGKEKAKLAADTMKGLQLTLIDLDDKLLPWESKWHFDIVIILVPFNDDQNEQRQREIVLSFYDFSRFSKLSVNDIIQGELSNHSENWCKVPLNELYIFENLYLQRVCALFSPLLAEDDE